MAVCVAVAVAVALAFPDGAAVEEVAPFAGSPEGLSSPQPVIAVSTAAANSAVPIRCLRVMARDTSTARPPRTEEKPPGATGERRGKGTAGGAGVNLAGEPLGDRASP